MWKKYSILLLLITMFSCNPKDKVNVGDIQTNVSLDGNDFKPCNEYNIKQYYVRASQDDKGSYRGEKVQMVNEFKKEFNYKIPKHTNGYITIRFIINCEGKTGRFRTEEMDFEYKKTSFDSSLSNNLIKAIQSLKGWIPRSNSGKKFDTYQYLTFKIEKGTITHILP
jgi:hypothetical protein